MQNTYIIELLDSLQKTQIHIRNEQGSMNYEEGISKLTDQFIVYKRNASFCFFIGNGGSCAIASHMTADFMKNGGMKTYSLYDSAVTTCMGNDYGYEYVFSKPLGFLGREKDLLVAVSSSGESQNIINAVNAAKKKKMDVITFTGFKPDNKVKQAGDINVYVPSEKYGMVESIHNLILQQIVDSIMEQDGVSL